MFVRHRTGKDLRERGDTIVEVLVAIAVVSLVLGGAYVTTNRSLLATRDAEERSVALKLTESQLEQLKGFARDNPEAIFGAGVPNPFCITNTNTVVSASDEGCTVNPSGAPSTVEPSFTLNVSRAGDGNTFTVVNEWTDVSGDIKDNIRMVYRIYE